MGGNMHSRIYRIETFPKSEWEEVKKNLKEAVEKIDHLSDDSVFELFGLRNGADYVDLIVEHDQALDDAEWLTSSFSNELKVEVFQNPVDATRYLFKLEITPELAKNYIKEEFVNFQESLKKLTLEEFSKSFSGVRYSLKKSLCGDDYSFLFILGQGCYDYCNTLELMRSSYISKEENTTILIEAIYDYHF